MHEPVLMDINKLLRRTSLFLTNNFKHSPEYTKLRKEWKITRKKIRHHLYCSLTIKAVLYSYSDRVYYILARNKTMAEEIRYQANNFLTAVKAKNPYYFIEKLFNYQPHNEIDDNDVDFDE